MAKQFRFEIGAILKDAITGFTGVVVCRTEYITGCLQYGISPTKVNKDGTRPSWEWFDEDRLSNTGKKIKLPGEALAKREEIAEIKKARAHSIASNGFTLKRAATLLGDVFSPTGGPQPTAPER